MFLTAVVQNSQIPRQPEQEAELFEAEVGTREMAAPAFAVGRFDQSLQHIKCGRLDAVTQEELLPEGENALRRESATTRIGSALPAQCRSCECDSFGHCRL